MLKFCVIHSIRLAVLLTISLLAFTSVKPVFSAPSDAARQEFVALAQSPTTAQGCVYAVHDDAGNEMDSPKIIASPSGGYLAVYHTGDSTGLFVVSLATSRDLLHWHFVRQMGRHASQPFLYQCSNGGFVIVWEQSPNIHAELRYYANVRDLLAGVVSNSYDAPDLLSKCAEGTPNIYSVDFHSSPPTITNSTISMGGHYYRDCLVDRQLQSTVTNFNSWTESPNDKLSKAIENWGVQGNIGQRDSTTYRGHLFGLVEGDSVKGNWADWNVYCYDYQTGVAKPLKVVTAGGSKSFCNPHCTSLIGPDGKPAIVFSLFLPGEGAAKGEAGPMIYYVDLK